MDWTYILGILGIVVNLYLIMTDCLDVVPIGIEHESPIVVRMIMGAQAGRAVIFSARGYCCVVERVNGRPIVRPDCDVSRFLQLAFAANPEARFAAAAETGSGCFWGMQDLIRRYEGVISTRVGYPGGDVANATQGRHDCG
jgi:hypothetical protein